MLLLGAWDVHLYDPQILLGLLREEIPYLGADGTRCRGGSSVVTLPERGTAHDRRYGSWSRAGEPAGVAVFP